MEDELATSRNVIGYGNKLPDVKWPNNAKLALSIVLNYEEGGENCILDGDAASEHLLCEITGGTPLKGQRHMNVESLYEYGSRAGFWRLHRELTNRNLPVTVYAVALALQKNPIAAAAMVNANWEIASHGYRWIDYQFVEEEAEREHIRKAVKIHEQLVGVRPYGIYQGKPNRNTRRIVVEEGGFLYDNDSYADDLPYYTYFRRKKDSARIAHLVLPYTLDVNDMRFAQGLEANKYFEYLKDCFDQLYEEGQAGLPRMMTIGLHCRVVGRPARTVALKRFLDYVHGFDDVWIARRIDIARHWVKNCPPETGTTLNVTEV